MTPDQLALAKQINRIFFPHMASRIEKARASQARFAHYTSAETALNIIRSKTLWMRNTRVMSDYMEVWYGYRLLQQFFHDQKHQAAFNAALESIAAGLGQEVVGRFDKSWDDIQFHTYVTCLSEHANSENDFGRLSMWRAFGRLPARAVLILKLPADGSAAGLGVVISPVAYFQYPELEREILGVLQNISDSTDFLKTQPRQLLSDNLLLMLMYAAVSLKHIGFNEEKEWRLIFTPNIRPSKLLKKSAENVDSVPQFVYKLPLENRPAEGVENIDISQVLERIIIGPTAYPVQIRDVFVQALLDAGIADAADRVVASNIPLRM